jgi:hypothetical protein
VASPDDDDELWLTRFGDIVGRYLRRDGMSPAAGAAAFTEPIDHAFLQGGDGDHRVEGLLWQAWAAVIEAAARTRDDAARARLADLLSAIRDRGPLARPDGQECVIWGSMKAHVDLPVFGAQMRETWNETPPIRSAESWANLNAFAAQLTLGGIDFSLYAIWALRDALEDDEYELALVLPAAVQWLRLAGPALAALARKGATYQIGDHAGPLCRRAGLTAAGFSTRRWEFWRNRLEEIAASRPEPGGLGRDGLRYLLSASRENK